MRFDGPSENHELALRVEKLQSRAKIFGGSDDEGGVSVLLQSQSGEGGVVVSPLSLTTQQRANRAMAFQIEEMDGVCVEEFGTPQRPKGGGGACGGALQEL